MRLRVLGCSGGVGPSRRTTSLLLDDDVLIDAGSGVGELSLEEMAQIRHIFLTHSHLDHIAFIPLLLDSIFDQITQPLVVHGLPATLDALRQHIFNWVIWPDFSKLPHPDQPVLRFEELVPGTTVTLAGRNLEMVAVNHVVPAVGYVVDCPTGVFAFSGDTSTNETFWAGLNARERLDILVVEAAFCNADIEISRLSKHYCPSLLAADIVKLRHQPEICITHNKPGAEDIIYNECRAAMHGRVLRQLKGNEIFHL